MQSISRALWSTFALFATGGLLSGCGAEVGGDSSEDTREEVKVIRQAVFACGNPEWGCCDKALYAACDAVSIGRRSTNFDVDFYFKLFTCHTTPSSTTPFATCPVEDGFYLIGGGAATLGRAEAALKRSVPVSVGSHGSWGARSEGVLGPVSHGLKAYAVGMKMFNRLTGEEVNLDDDIHMYSSSSSFGNQVGVSKTVPSDELLLGGGFSGSTGTFAVDAYATGMVGGKWTVNGKQFGTSTGQILGRAITLSRCLPAANPVVCFDSPKITEAVSAVGTGIQGVVAEDARTVGAMVGVGVQSTSWWRPIWMMYPAALQDKDAAVGFTTAPTSASGSMTTQLMTLGF